MKAGGSKKGGRIEKIRLDDELLRRRLVHSKREGWALVVAGKVSVNGVIVRDASHLVSSETGIVIKEKGYVSKGGAKLSSCLDRFGIDPSDKTCADIGSGTGGFTDCLLKRGAKRVYCVDVGYGIIHYSLRNDPRVVLLERKNVRFLKSCEIGEELDLAVIDVSFISLKMVLPVVKEILKEGGEALPLVKPQFEVKREDVEKGGVVRDEAKRLGILNSIKEFCKDLGFSILNEMELPSGRRSKNIEYFLHLKKEIHRRV